MTHVLDASVAIKLYVPEDDSDVARLLVGQAGELFAPDIFLVEVARARLCHTREVRMTYADLRAAIGDLSSLVSIPFLSATLVASALDFSQRLEHRLHVCMYLALADRLGFPLLTADDRLVRKLRAAGAPPSIQSINDQTS